MKKFFVLLVVSMSLFWSCSNKGNNKIKVEENDLSKYSEKRYLVKSAKVLYDVEVSGNKFNSVKYFDDFGSVEINEIIVKKGDKEYKTTTIIRDSVVWEVDYDKKIYSQNSISETDLISKINYNNLTDDIVREYNIVDKGIEEFLNRQCRVYTLKLISHDTSGKLWVYKGIVLRAEISAQGIQISIRATEFDENYVLDQNLVRIPEMFTKVSH